MIPIAGDCDGDRPAIIPARELLDVLKGGNGGAEIRVGDDGVTLDMIGCRRNWDCVEEPVGARPITSGATLASFRAPAAALADALRRALPFAAKGDTRYALNGVSLH